MRYLLDTNIVSDLVRTPNGPAARNIMRVGEANVWTSVVVASELRYGVENKRSAALTKQVDAVLSVIKILPLAQPVDVNYGRVRALLERRGQMIGANDLLIAAHAISESAILVTDNLSEFERIDELTCENWLRR